MIKKVISAVTAVTNPHHPIYPPKLQNQKTEYIKCKMNVAELFENLFLLESQQTSISDDGKAHEFRIETPEIHDEGGVLVDNLPAGQYTLELRSHMGNQIFSQSRTIDIAESNHQQLIAEVFDTNITLKKGDTDGNNIVDSSDASRILAEYSAISTGSSPSFSNSQKRAADVNSDGKIDSTDASKILEHYANISIGGTGTL